jgi:putative ABC transport system permease protein
MIDWKPIVRARLDALSLQPAAESELAEELAQHLEDLYDDLRRGGRAHDEAYRLALSELDDLCAARPHLGAGAGFGFGFGFDLDKSKIMPRREPVPIGDARTSSLIGDLRRDLRYAARTLRSNPLFVIVVVLTLGLGIGANTTVFTVINTLMLNPMPVAAPSELVAVASVASPGTSPVAAAAGAAAANTMLPLSHPDFADYQRRNSVFRSLAGHVRMRGMTWTPEGGGTQPLLCELVTGSYFPTLDVHFAAGRAFGPEADGRDGAQAVAVMNHGTWQTRFGGAPDIIGRQLRLNGVVVTVVGVTRPGFIGVNGLVGPDLWLPFALGEQLLPAEMRTAATDRAKPMMQGIGRLKEGVTLARAQAEMGAIAATLAREFPAANGSNAIAVRPIADTLTGGGAMRMAGLLLAAVAGVVLLIACSNVANLLLARSAARQHEMAVRAALGASRARLVRQLLTESLCLGLISGGIGVSIAYGALRLLAKTLPATGAFGTSRLDATVLMFALFVSIATGIVFGIIPAIGASRASVTGMLNEARAAGRSARRVRVANVLLVGQVALSFVLLVTAALFSRSIERAYGIDPGFAPARLAVFITNPGQAGYGEARTKQFYQQVRERVARMPGIESVSWASNMPLFARPVGGLQIEGRVQRSPSETVTTIVNTIDLGYFDTAGVTVERGRAFADGDREAALPVAIVNQKLARDYWPGEDAIGKRIRLPGEQRMREIVGVARIANYTSWGEAAQACVYLPLEQNALPAMTLYVRGAGDPAQYVNAVNREIAAVGPGVMISGIRTGQQVIDGSLFQARIGVALLSVFGLIALGLASIGLYGILVYMVNQRRREIGLRMALGASQGSVRRLIVTKGMSLVVIGIAIGFAAALLVARALSRMLYGVGATDPISLGGAAAVLGVVALVACYLPARRATRVDPLIALRQA